MAEPRGAIQQEEFTSRDAVYALIKVKPLKPNTITKMIVGLVGKRVMKAEIDSGCYSTQKRITITVNDFWEFTARFVVKGDEWIATSYIPWTEAQAVFSSPEQFTKQYLAYHIAEAKAEAEKKAKKKQTIVQPLLFSEAL